MLLLGLVLENDISMWSPHTNGAYFSPSRALNDKGFATHQTRQRYSTIRSELAGFPGTPQLTLLVQET